MCRWRHEGLVISHEKNGKLHIKHDKKLAGGFVLLVDRDGHGQPFAPCGHVDLEGAMKSLATGEVIGDVIDAAAV